MARLQGVVVGVNAALIAEVVSHKNRGKMYIWWMPWF
jgi:serine/threonine-protein kinase ATR